MLCEHANLRHAGLDDWTRFFGLHAEERHHASADALVTAELALILFSHARRQQIDSPCGWRKHSGNGAGADSRTRSDCDCVSASRSVRGDGLGDHIHRRFDLLPVALELDLVQLLQLDLLRTKVQRGEDQ